MRMQFQVFIVAWDRDFAIENPDSARGKTGRIAAGYNPDMGLQGVNLFCFAASYSVALLLEVLRWLRPQRPFPHILTYGFALAGLFAQAVYLFVYALPLRGEANSLLFVSWILGIFYLYGAIHHRRQAWGVFVLPVVLGLVLLAGLIGKVSQYERTSPAEVTDYSKFWIIAHVALLLLGGVGLGVGFIASIMYLVQSRKLRHKALPDSGLPLLSLERLEKMILHGVDWSFPLLTTGLLIGLALLRDAGLSWLDPKVLSSMLLWVVFALLLYIRHGLHQRGRRFAAWTIAAFVFLVVAFVVETLAPSWHRFEGLLL